jgi:hypothetical protein
VLHPITEDLLSDDREPSFQLYFPDDEFVQKSLGKTTEELYTDIFKSTGGDWRNEKNVKFKTEFYKIRLFSEDFTAFRFPTLFEKVFIGRYEQLNREDSRFDVLEIGYFDIGKPFHTEDFYIQVAGEKVQNYFCNNQYFGENVWEKWEKVESFRVGQRKILEQNEILEIKKRNETLEKQLSKLLEDVEKAKYQSDISELQKLEKELEMLKQVQHDKKEIKKVETVSAEPENGNSYLIWNGKDLKDFGVPASSFEQFQEKVLEDILKRENFYREFAEKLKPKDEFELDSEFQTRKKKFGLKKKNFELEQKKRREKREKEILKELNFLNLYLGKQKVELKYNPEKAEFDVKVNLSDISISIDFKIEIPRNIAKNFKENVKNFDFYFSKDLALEKVSTNFENKVFSAKDFKKDILVEIEREREKVALKTITIENLMFQDFDLPDKD